MNKNLRAFMESSPASDKVKLDGKVIIQRTQLSPADIYNIRRKKQYGPVLEKDQICELEMGGQVLAKGRIVKKKGECYFKVSKVYN